MSTATTRGQSDRGPTQVGADCVRPVGFDLPPRFEPARLLGSGGQADVWLARDCELREWVAVKVFHSGLTATQRERLRREVSLGRRLQHPSLVRVFELLEAGEGIAVVMEFVPGGTAAQCLAAEERLAVERVVTIADEVLEALEVLHGEGVLHRDVKPSNLLIDAEGRIRLADLGLVRPLEQGHDLTQTAITVGTPGYMSPEQLRGQELGPASDLFSLGITMFELLAGTLPFAGASAFDIADRQLNSPVPRLRSVRPDCPAWLEAYVERLLEKEARNRFASAPSAREALNRRRRFASPRFLRRVAALLGAIALGGAAALVMGNRLVRDGAVQVRTAGTSVIVSDGHGGERWRREVAGVAAQAVGGRFTGEGPTEVAFMPAFATGVPPEQAVIEVRTADDRPVVNFPASNGEFALMYPFFRRTVAGASLATADLDGDGGPELIWVLHHAPWFPSLVGVWRGRTSWAPRAAFVNSGDIHTMVPLDVDGDGINELVVAGLNNPLGYQRFVAILDGFELEREAAIQRVSPDLASVSAAVFNGPGGLSSYTLLGGSTGGRCLVSMDRGGLVISDPQVSYRIDRDGNPAGSVLAGKGPEPRRAFWKALADLSLRVGSGTLTATAEVDAFLAGSGSALTETPNVVAAHLTLASAAARAGNHALAVATLQRGEAMVPEASDLSLRLGEQLALSGHASQARMALERATLASSTSRSPLDAAIVLSILAAVEQDAPGGRRADESVSIASSADVGTQDDLVALMAFGSGDWSSPALATHHGTDLLPIVDVLRSWAGMERGELLDSVVSRAVELADNPEIHESALTLQGEALRRSGRLVEARQLLESAIPTLDRRARQELDCWFALGIAEHVLGEVLEDLGNRTAAKSHFDRARALAPRCWWGRH